MSRSLAGTRVRKRAVCVVILNPKGHVLAVGRPGLPGKFGLPGGHVEPGESLSQAISRETAEETGALLVSERVVYQHQADGTDVTCYVGRFIGKPFPAEGLPVAWVPPAALCSSSNSPFAGFNRGLFSSMRRQGYRV